MVRIIVSDKGKEEANRLDFDIEAAIAKIVQYVPKKDLIGLDHIFVTDLPEHWRKHLAKARASYFEKQRNRPPHIELYLQRIFSHIKSADSLGQMLPIQYIGIAQTILHEVGHHVERTRSHGIKKNKREVYVVSYAKGLLSDYILDNANSINSCFDHLEEVADERGLSVDILGDMRAGWERQYRAALNKTGPS